MNEMPFTEISRMLQAQIEFEFPEDDQALIYARMVGTLLAWTDKETLIKIVELRQEECNRCGKLVLPSQHSEMGCDL